MKVLLTINFQPKRGKRSHNAKAGAMCGLLYPSSVEEGKWKDRNIQPDTSKPQMLTAILKDGAHY
uniref:hypothetical protein n=1 Tax=Salmonella sp. TaxID=599 RepID=UPI001CD988DD|nr:hypothetical protein [Salmonella sp.]